MKKINLLDLIAVSIVTLLVILAVLSYYIRFELSGRPILVTVRVSQNADIIYPEAVKTKMVYFNSINRPVEESQVNKNNGTVDISLRSLGVIEGDRAVFNGVRVLIGQKAEIHGSYFAPGVVSEIKYAD